MKKLRILIADDHALVRYGVRGLLQTHEGWKIVGEAANGREAVGEAKKLKPDLVILDLSMPELDGLEAIHQIVEAVPSAKVLILTLHESGQMVRRVFEAGASGYVLKSDLAVSLLKAAKAVSEGKHFLTPKVSEIVLQGFLKNGDRPQQTEPAQAHLTPRETEIIRLLAEGKTNKEIAALLGITAKTVETFRGRIMLKAGLHSLAELIRYAMRHDIVSS
jgi:DNA-binding NarL/FixJ family response regulator